MSDVLSLVREEGYQAFLSGNSGNNPYTSKGEEINWREWEAGYRQAMADNSVPTD
jgi:ribosome modulation factor